MIIRFLTLLATLTLSSVCHASLLQGLTAYWDFEGNANNNAAASGGSAFHGLLENGATISGTVTKVGSGSLQLDGSDDHMKVPATVNVNQAWSLSAWFRLESLPNGTARSFVYETVGSYAISYGLREGSTAANTNFQLFNQRSGGDLSQNFDVADATALNTWHHILTTFTPSTATTSGLITGYLNGVPRYSLTIPANSSHGTATGLHLGTYRLADGRFFHGTIDEVAFWNRTITAQEAVTVYQMGNDGTALSTGTFFLSLSAQPATHGSVIGAGAVPANESVAISATAGPGYRFTGWTGDFTGQPASFTHIATASITAAATFGEDDADNDSDGLTNYQEIVIHQTLSGNSDTDGDGIPDGKEITFGTSPLHNDAALVAFVRENLTDPQVGGIALTTPQIQRDAVTKSVILRLSLSVSADHTDWHFVDLRPPSCSLAPSAAGWKLTFPAPDATVYAYYLLAK